MNENYVRGISSVLMPHNKFKKVSCDANYTKNVMCNLSFVTADGISPSGSPYVGRTTA